MSHLVISNRKIDNAEYFKNPEELEIYLRVNPKDVLVFVFWSWIVPKWMLDTYKCYGLHTGPLLEGRGKGGSPIDNLKALNIPITTVCAFEMTADLDGGRVRVAVPLRLKYPKQVLINDIDRMLPDIVDYLMVDNAVVPEKFTRLPDAE